MEKNKMKTQRLSLFALVFLLFAGLSSGARDPGTGPFPLQVANTVWQSPKGDFVLIFKNSKDNSKRMDVFLTSDCQTYFFGSSERVRRLDEDTFVMHIRDQNNRLWFGFFKVMGKLQMLRLTTEHGTQTMDFGITRVRADDAALSCQ
jgi:hypothetical protein